MDSLVWTAVFGPPSVRDAARRAIREAAESLGILPASILPLYKARGRGEVSGFTVPAINVRMLSYDTARAALPRGRARSTPVPLIFEIARSEMGYTEQRPAEYAAVMLAAAIREGWEGPFFLQGDHFQTNPKKMKENAGEGDRRDRGADRGGDPGRVSSRSTSTPRRSWTSRSRPSSRAAAVNVELAARFTKFIRAREPEEMPISVGGEIGEVGKENSTPEEFRAYMDVYRKALGGGDGHREGLDPDRLLARRHRGGPTARSSGSRSTSRRLRRRSRRSPARSTAWPARSSTAPRRCRPSTSATSPTTTAPRSTWRPSSRTWSTSIPSLPLP